MNYGNQFALLLDVKVANANTSLSLKFGNLVLPHLSKQLFVYRRTLGERMASVDELSGVFVPGECTIQYVRQSVPDDVRRIEGRRSIKSPPSG